MSASPVLPLPQSYSWGFVVANSIHAVGDTIDDEDRYPEARGSTGRVTFTPLIRFRKELDPPTAFVQHEIVTARIRDGVMIDAEEHEGIYLITGVYDVSFTIEDGSIPGFQVEVTEDHTKDTPLDLVTASPYVPPPGSSIHLFEIPTGFAPGHVLAWSDGGLSWSDPSAITPSPGFALTPYRSNPLDPNTVIDGVYEASGDPVHNYIIANKPVGDLTPTFYESSNWSGSITIDNVRLPSLIHATLDGDVTLNLGTPSFGASGTITLVLAQDFYGGHEITIPGAMASWGVPIVPTPDTGSVTMIHLLWTGQEWVALLAAANIGYL